MTTFLQQKKIPQHLHDTIVSHVTRLTTQQTTNMQHHPYVIFAGLLPLSWTQSTSPTTGSQQDRSTINNWASQFSAWMIKQGYEAWMLRNKQIHKDDDNTSTIHQYLNNKIRQLYQLQGEIGYHDRDIFSRPIEDRLNLSEKQKMTWIDQTTKTIKVGRIQTETDTRTKRYTQFLYQTKKSQ